MSSGEEELLVEIVAGLGRGQKELPSKLFYDERGSELFEQITRLPEYYLTRAEEGLLRERVPAWVADYAPRSLVELGAGSAAKTRVILDAMRDCEINGIFVPVDISAEFLGRTAERVRAEYSGLTVTPVAADFTRSIELPASLPRPALFTFLGSTLGNFASAEAVELLRRLRALMNQGDFFLLGVDLRKDVAVLEAAYNDARGVTAEFNLNLLRVVNRRFGADFDLDGFRHDAVYAAGDHRIEMHLVSTRPQSVHVPGAGEFLLEEGETIRTEVSCKYDRQSVAAILAESELAMREWWEAPGGLFALCVAEIPAPPTDRFSHRT